MKLPLECSVDYHNGFITSEESREIFHWIITHCEGLNGQYMSLADGSEQWVDNGLWLFVDNALMDFSLFSQWHGRRKVWPPMIEKLRDRLERFVGAEFSVCLCNYYQDGTVGMGFHSDLFTSYGPTSQILSISLGEERTFAFRRKSNHSELYAIELQNGSLLIMGEGSQEEYEHALPTNPKYINPRVNLTFRMFSWPEGFKRKNRIERAP